MATLQTFAQWMGFLPRHNISSPWGDADAQQLQRITVAEVYGEEVLAAMGVSRADAMQVGPVSRGRQVICGSIAPLPLIALRREQRLEAQPRWLQWTPGIVSPLQRMTWTLDDLLFYGESLWQVERGTENQILNAWRVPWHLWEVTAEGHIRVGHEGAREYVPASSLIYFPGHVEGLLTRARTTLLSAAAVTKAVERRARSPIPVMEIHQTDAQSDLTQTEAELLVAEYNRKRRDDPDGVTIFTPADVELKPHGDRADSGHMVEGRNALRLDIANHLGLPASVLEGSLSTASLTYSTQEGAEHSLTSLGLGPWMDAVTSRLSQDDVTPQGTVIRFDAAYLMTPNPSPTGPVTED